MYSQYQGNRSFIAMEPEPESPPEQGKKAPSSRRASPQDPAVKESPLLGELTGGLSQLLSGVRKHFSLESLDTGDILLVLIILFLYLEGDNLELAITLGLMLLLGLGED